MASVSRAQYFDTLHLYYPIGNNDLNVGQKAILDSVVHTVETYVLIYSSADYLGSEKSNRLLADRRAKSVRQYLLAKGFPPERIRECSGLGQINTVALTPSEHGNSRNRRTDIFIKRNTPGTTVAKTIATGKKDTAGILHNTATPNAKNELARKTDSAKITFINLDTLKEQDAVALRNLNFYPGMAILLPDAHSELENLYHILDANPGLRIRLEGHVCCCIYPDGYFENTDCWALSVSRARAIYRHLTDRGIAPERLGYTGFGRTQPLFQDDEYNNAHAVANRRVVVRIIGR
ncbi:MAG: OmpA family protein [Edaphocola sp.]